ncbi:DNA-3-methyladenine glycosylase family protein [Derxia lacustris]|uniref:DNA-3-methyladenine glycosylase family protein n=1 Tax=Derxia lacustris TaxID=764842 RepID=UPI000A173E03|nr:DNA-3-methyladenine glycosylase [Derxia lacustris]
MATRVKATDGSVKSVALKRSKIIEAVETVALVTPVGVAPAYWDEAREALIDRDRIMRKLIPQYAGLHLSSRGEPFTTLARAIVGQQISTKSADAIWGRFSVACGEVAPERVAAMTPEALAGCGLSKRKTDYLRDLALHFADGQIHAHDWHAMDDEAIIGELTSIRGIGRWTAEMFLIFNLMRPNVFPIDDLGLLKAIGLHYFSGEPVTRSEAREVAANWEPWRTVATWYLWRSLDPIPVEY